MLNLLHLFSLSIFHPYFGQSNCAQYAADRKEEETMCDHLISASKHRDHVTANQLKQKILNILTNKHGAWGAVAQRYSCVRVWGCFFNCGHFWPYSVSENKLLKTCFFMFLKEVSDIHQGCKYNCNIVKKKYYNLK